jgi:tetratricopeptide (TPR) repeat protein
MALQDEIVKSLCRELSIEIEQVESGHSSDDPNVHELVFKGWAAINAGRREGLEALKPAQALFDKALERDPQNTRALLGTAAFHTLVAVQLYAPDPAPHLEKAEAILQRLIERHPSLSGAHANIGLINIARQRSAAAVPAFERAIQLNPSDAGSHAQLGRALIRLGRAQEGLDHVHYAMRLSPRDPSVAFWFGFAGFGELELGRVDKAIEDFERADALHPAQPRTTLALISAYAMAGRMSEARRRLAQLQQARPHLTHDALRKIYTKPLAENLVTAKGILKVLNSEPDTESRAAR